MLDVRVPGKLHFKLLGAALVVDNRSDRVRISAQKGFALLAYLAVHAGRAISRSVLAGLLWGDRTEAQARQNLRQAILTLRRDLGPANASVLQTDDQFLALGSDAIAVDALEFAACAEAADLTVRLRCLEIPWGSFLAGFSVGTEAFDEWLVAERHRLDALAVRTFADLASKLDAAGDGERAILAVERLIVIDPGDEEQHRRLLRMERRHRGRDAALARARSLVALLKRELDADPEAATQALIDEIRAETNAPSPPDRPPVHPEPLATVAPDPVMTPVAAAATPRRHPWRWAAAGFGALLLAGFGFLGVQRASDAPPGGAPAAERPQSNGQQSTGPWQSPRLPSQRARDGIAPGRGLVAIMVLPFTSYGQSGADAIPEMMADDLTRILSHVSALRVISHQTALGYRGQSIDPAKIGAELGIHYLIEGSISLQDNVLRVNVALVDIRSRLQVWSGRFDRTGANRHEVQAEIVKSIGRELDVSVSASEVARTSDDPDVHALIFKGYSAIQASRHFGVDGLRPAEQHFSDALQRDPDAVRATVGLGLYHAHMAVQLFAPDPAPHLAKAEEILQSVIARYPNFSEAHGGMGLVHVARGKSQDAIAAFERVVALNPSSAPSYAQLGRLLVRIGREQEGLAYILYAMRLSPRDPIIGYWLAFAGYAELELGNFESAVAYLDRAHALNPTQPRTLLSLIAANMWAGHVNVARQQLAKLQKQHPHLSHERLRKMYGEHKDKKNSAGIMRALEHDPSAAGSPAAGSDPWRSPPMPSGRASGGQTEQSRGLVPIIILPFTTYDETGSVRLLADMMTDDLTNTLSRIRFFRVISRQTARSYQGQSVDAAARDLGVRYALEGSVRMQGDMLRVAVELIDTATKAVAWSARIERDNADRRGVQDEIVAQLARELQITTYPLESARLSNDAGADALAFRGMAALTAAFSNISLDAYQRAEALFSEALKRDPEHVLARLGLGSYHANIAVQRLVPDSDRHLKTAFDIVTDVIRQKPAIGGAHHQLGIILQGSGRLKEAIEAFERALEINPSSAGSYAHIGFALARLGRPAQGLEHIRYAMRLSPKDPSMAIWLEFAGTTELELGHHQEAIENYRRSIALTPAYPRPWAGLVAAQALAGHLDAARISVDKLRALAPDLRDEQLFQRFARTGARVPQLRAGLRLALALPEP